MSSRLLEIPGVGPITASVLATELGDAQQYANARQFAASVELVPRQYSTGGKPTLLGISNLLSALWRPVPRHASRYRSRRAIAGVQSGTPMSN